MSIAPRGFRGRPSSTRVTPAEGPSYGPNILCAREPIRQLPPSPVGPSVPMSPGLLLRLVYGRQSSTLLLATTPEARFWLREKTDISCLRRPKVEATSDIPVRLEEIKIASALQESPVNQNITGVAATIHMPTLPEMAHCMMRVSLIQHLKSSFYRSPRGFLSGGRVTADASAP